VINALVNPASTAKTSARPCEPATAVAAAATTRRSPATGEQFDLGQDPQPDGASQALALIVGTGGDATRINLSATRSTTTRSW
jgi:hypothetical protein